MLYPLKFVSVYKENVWGGNLLREIFHKETPSDHTGESWEIACHDHGMSIVAEGPLKGISLIEVFEKYKTALLGPMAENYNHFPFLVKLIDAKDKLSLQVHPDDWYAKLLENGENGKCEMWYVLRAKKGAKIVMGLKDGVTKHEFIQSMLDGDFEKVINEMMVSEGDVINIPAGLIHAIEDDIMVAEVQQNSDTVYRVYDWNRKGLDGVPRELHIEKALGCIDFDDSMRKEKVKGISVGDNHHRRHYYIANSHFAIEKLDIIDSVEEDTEERKMIVYICLKEAFDIIWQDGKVHLEEGEAVLIPAELGKYRIAGHSEILKAYIPDINKDIIEPLKLYQYSMADIEENLAMM